MTAASFAIRFVPVDPTDASPALYLSTDRDAADHIAGTLTALPGDLAALRGHDAPRMLSAPAVVQRCRSERLRASVVYHEDAMADVGRGL